MVPDRQKVRTEGQNGRTGGRSQNYIPPTLSGDNERLEVGKCVMKCVQISSEHTDPSLESSCRPTIRFCHATSGIKISDYQTYNIMPWWCH